MRVDVEVAGSETQRAKERASDSRRGRLSSVAIASVLVALLTVGGLPPTLGGRRSVEGMPTAIAATAPSVSPPASSPVAGVAPILSPLAAILAGSPAPPFVTGEHDMPSPDFVLAPLAIDSMRRVARLAEPDGLTAIAVRGGSVYVTPDRAQRPEILVLSLKGKLIRRLPVATAQDQQGQLSALAVRGNGRLLVANAVSGRILELDPSSGNQTAAIQIPSLPPCLGTVSGLPVPETISCAPVASPTAPRPVGLAVGPSNDLFIADEAQQTVWRVGQDGKPQTFFQSDQFTLGNRLRGIWASPAASGLTVVTEAGVYTVTTANGVVSSRRIMDLSPATAPVAVTRTSADELILALQAQNRIVGVGTRTLDVTGNTTTFTDPVAITSDADGHVWVVDKHGAVCEMITA